MNKELKVWFNGKLIPWRDATVPILSHGFSRASAIFDVFGIHPGPQGPVAFRMDDHLKRLMKSAELLEMELAYNTEEIVEAVKATVKANNLGRGLIKVVRLSVKVAQDPSRNDSGRRQGLFQLFEWLSGSQKRRFPRF
ncbi:MAG: aminotransferase class IV [Deltaproteobacteria bacterium]|nr:aminotransferase class IV [Deltaproteobacteria bacterium]